MHSRGQEVNSLTKIHVHGPHCLGQYITGKCIYNYFSIIHKVLTVCNMAILLLFRYSVENIWNFNYKTYRGKVEDRRWKAEGKSIMKNTCYMHVYFLVHLLTRSHNRTSIKSELSTLCHSFTSNEGAHKTSSLVCHIQNLMVVCIL